MVIGKQDIRDAGRIYAYTENRRIDDRDIVTHGFQLEKPDSVQDSTAYELEEIYSVVVDPNGIQALLVQDRKESYTPAHDLDLIDKYAEEYSNAKHENRYWFKSPEEFQEIMLPFLI